MIEGQKDLSLLVGNPRLCSHLANELQREVAWNTIHRRGVRGLKQYGRYFALFWVLDLVNTDMGRAQRNAHLWLRRTDDVGDGDAPLPRGYSSRGEFLLGKRNLIRQLSSGQSPVYGDREDILLVDHLLASKRLGVDLTQETLAVMDTIIFDGERARQKRIPTREELDEYFRNLDFACIEGGLKLARERCAPEDLASLSWATRTAFNLRDFPVDFGRGIINIPEEDVETYGVDLTKLEGTNNVAAVVEYKPMKRWYEDQLDMGLGFMRDWQKVSAGLDLKVLTHLAIELNFTRPINKTFCQVANLLYNSF